MEKILLTIDALNPDWPSLEFAAYIACLTRSKITGVFLENKINEFRTVSPKLYSFSLSDGRTDSEVSMDHNKSDLIEKNIDIFRQSCISKDICFAIHRDRGNPFRELKEESRFADLIIAEANTSFSKLYEGALTGFVKDILKHSECPVILAPESFDEINEIIFAYNGSASSVFAIKQFTYLFAELRNIKIVILRVNSEGRWHDPDKYILKEWLKGYYKDLHFEALKGEADTELFGYLLKKRNVMVVMGAYGRNTVSQIFKSSHADLLIKTLNLPIFITHR